MSAAARISSKWMESLRSVLHARKHPVAVSVESFYGFPLLPDASSYRTALAQAFYMAVGSRSDLAVAFLQVRDCPRERRGEIAGFLRIALGKAGQVHSPSESCLALILPEMGSERASFISFRLLQLVSRNFPDACLKLHVVCYPERVSTLDGFEAELSAVAGEYAVR